MITESDRKYIDNVVDDHEKNQRVLRAVAYIYQDAKSGALYTTTVFGADSSPADVALLARTLAKSCQGAVRRSWGRKR